MGIMAVTKAVTHEVKQNASKSLCGCFVQIDRSSFRTFKIKDFFKKTNLMTLVLFRK